MENKTKLIKALRTSSRALSDGTVHYNWTAQESCNCGVVAQAILGIDAATLEAEWDHIADATHFKKLDYTWQNAVKVYCPITGEPMVDLLRRLSNAGLTKESLVHLEYLSNEAILERAGLSKTKMAEVSVVTKTEEVTTKVLFGTKTVKTDHVENRMQEVQDKQYHTSMRMMELIAVANQDFEKAAELRDAIKNNTKTEDQS